jgi:putative membrane protein
VAGGFLIAGVEDQGPYEDPTFLKTTALSLLFKAEFGNLAATKGSAESVKAFAQHMNQRYSTIFVQLKSLAEKKGVALPTGFDVLQQNTLDYLSAQRGAAIDREYAGATIDDLGETLRSFKRAAGQSKDAEIKAFAEEAVPLIDKDLHAARKVLLDLPQPILK